MFSTNFARQEMYVQVKTHDWTKEEDMICNRKTSACTSDFNH